MDENLGRESFHSGFHVRQGGKDGNVQVREMKYRGYPVPNLHLTSDKVAPPPGVTVAAVRMVKDPNDEPQYGDRIPYVIIRGELNSRLVDRAVAPEELFRDRCVVSSRPWEMVQGPCRYKRLDAIYYITKVLIPPLSRVFNLVGADVQAWYDEMPKTQKVDRGESILTFERDTPARKKGGSAHKFKIDDHFRSSLCVVCGKVTSGREFRVIIRVLILMKTRPQ
jgi:DNA polymerase zeta